MKILSTGWIGPEGLGADGLPASFETPLDVGPLLKDRKTGKFMAKQDKLALIACHRAVQAAGLQAEALAQRTGIYLSVGPLPFEEPDLDLLHDKSIEGGKFSLRRATDEAFQAMNPLLTFKCLPNMPVFHVSFNLAIRGGYHVAYPGAGQFLTALDLALRDLGRGRFDHAILGAVTDQRNTLTRHHLDRTEPGASARAVDVACAWVITRLDETQGLAKIRGLTLGYKPRDPFGEPIGARGPLLGVAAGTAGPALRVAFDIAAGRPLPSYDWELEDGVTARLELEGSA